MAGLRQLVHAYTDGLHDQGPCGRLAGRHTVSTNPLLYILQLQLQVYIYIYIQCLSNPCTCMMYMYVGSL